MPGLRRAALSAALVAPVAVAGGTVAPSPAHGMPTRVAAASYGGVLNVLAPGDTDYLDPNITYYSFGYSLVREFSRQLYTWPAEARHQTDLVPDLATAMPSISDHGRTYRITIRPGAKWDTSPVRQVSAADVVRGVKTTCNPWQPFGGLPNFDDLLVGFHHFCQGFARVDITTRAMRRYMNNHDFRGVHVGPHNRRVVVFRLTHRATYFTDMLALPAFSPRAREMLRYAPGSYDAAEHTVSDGPYKVSSYEPARKLVYVRNPAWSSSTDAVRHAYANRIVIRMGIDSHEALLRMRSGDGGADILMGSLNYDDAARRREHHDPQMTVSSGIASNPYLLFNTRSPNENGALQQVDVRQALSYALNRPGILRAIGHPSFMPPLTHVLPKQIVGSRHFNLYPHERTKARSMLRHAGHASMTLTFLYRYSSPTSVAIYKTVKRQLAHVGVTVEGRAVADAAFYVNYLQNPSSARRGKWDMSLAGWGPDWYRNAALSFFKPLFDGRIQPPSSSNFGLFNSPRVNNLIDEGARAPRKRAADLWHQADVAVMRHAPFYPLTNSRMALYHAAQAHHAVSMPQYQSADFTNVWLDPGNNGS